MKAPTQHKGKVISISNVTRNKSDKNRTTITLRGISDAERQRLRIPSYRYLLP